MQISRNYRLATCGGTFAFSLFLDSSLKNADMAHHPYAFTSTNFANFFYDYVREIDGD